MIYRILDYQRTIRRWIQDGRLLRANFVSI